MRRHPSRPVAPKGGVEFLRQHSKLAMESRSGCSEMCNENTHNTTAGASYVLPLHEGTDYRGEALIP